MTRHSDPLGFAPRTLLHRHELLRLITTTLRAPLSSFQRDRLGAKEGVAHQACSFIHSVFIQSPPCALPMQHHPDAAEASPASTMFFAELRRQHYCCSCASPSARALAPLTAAYGECWSWLHEPLRCRALLPRMAGISLQMGGRHALPPTATEGLSAGQRTCASAGLYRGDLECLYPLLYTGRGTAQISKQEQTSCWKVLGLASTSVYKDPLPHARPTAAVSSKHTLRCESTKHRSCLREV